MACYCVAGQHICFDRPIPEMLPFEANHTEATKVLPFVPPVQTLFASAEGWVGEEMRPLECWQAPPGWLLRSVESHDVYIAPDGGDIYRVEYNRENEAINPCLLNGPLTELDRAILAGPALTLALALHDIWCLHASAVLFHDQLTAFVGESGQGKSTLAAYLAQAGAPEWRLAADDILPVTLSETGMQALPRFPQLKLPVEAQPGPKLPEQLHLDRICVLTPAGQSDQHKIQALPPALAVQAILRHTAGTRLFPPPLLDKHLHFSAQAAAQTPVYQLSYPRQWQSLPLIAQELENLC